MSMKDGIVSIKGADLTINKYIGRFHNDVTVEALRDYIESQGVAVVELKPLSTKHQRFKTFRLRIKRAQLNQVEDGEFWPEGVIVSPFFLPRIDGGNAGTSNAS